MTYLKYFIMRKTMNFFECFKYCIGERRELKNVITADEMCNGLINV